MNEGRAICRAPTPSSKSVRIPAWKFDAVRAAILETLAASPSGVKSVELPALVGARLAEDERARLGSLAWHTTTVKLELEVCGEIRRVEGSRPQVVRLPD